MQATKKNPPLNASMGSPMKSSIHINDIMNRSAPKVSLSTPVAESYQKNNIFAQSAPFPSNGETSPLNSSAYKFSKLQARKEKQTQLAATMASRKDPSSFLHEESPEMKMAAMSKEAEESLKAEKKSFLKKLYEENQLLMQLFEDIQESKESMMKRIKELELARETMHAMKTPSQLDSIDQYLIDECPLSENNRYELGLTTEKTLEAQRVYEKLVSIMTLFKSNYSQFIEEILERLNDISELFVDNHHKEMQDAINQLEQILLLNPKNIEAVKSLTKSIEKSLMSATTENLQDFLKKNVKQLKSAGSNLSMNQQQQSAATTAPAAPNNLATPVPSNLSSSGNFAGGNSINGDGYSEAKGESMAPAGSNKYSEEDIKAILAQNENLRSTVAQLRQRLAQVRVQSVNAIEKPHSSLYGNPKASKGSPAAVNVATLNNNNTPNREALMRKQNQQFSGTDYSISYNNNGNAPDSQQPQDGVEDTNSNSQSYSNALSSPSAKEIYNPDSSKALSLPTPKIPESLQLMLLNRLRMYLSQIISGNPAIPVISSNEILKSMIIEEVIQQTHHNIQHIYELFIKSDKEFEFIFEDSDTITNEFLEENPTLVLKLSESMDTTFHFSHVHGELVSWMALYTTYCYSRMGLSQSIVTEDPNDALGGSGKMVISPMSSAEDIVQPSSGPYLAEDEKEKSLRNPLTRSNSATPRYMLHTRASEKNLRSPTHPSNIPEKKDP